jgi:hypothetical protein
LFISLDFNFITFHFFVVIELANGEAEDDKDFKFDTLTNAAMNKYYGDKYKYELARQRLEDEKSEFTRELIYKHLISICLIVNSFSSCYFHLNKLFHRS